MVDIAVDRAPIKCEKTGLFLIPSSGQTVYRVATTEYGGLNPKKRAAGSPPAELSRWDTAGRTAYAGATPLGAYLEVLSHLTPDEQPETETSHYFDDVTEGDKQKLYAQIRMEMDETPMMKTGTIPRGWREDNRLFEIGLPETGWFVDVCASGSQTALRERFSETLRDEYEIEELQLSHLVADGDDARALTTMFAEWIRSQTLFDGERAHGIRYPSKYGLELINYAFWLRRLDDGTSTTPEPFSIRGSTAIEIDSKPLSEAAAHLKIRVF